MRRFAVFAVLVGACGPHAAKPPVDAGPPPAFAGVEPFAHAPTLERVSAKVAFDFAAQRLTGDATLTIRDDGIAEFPIVFDAHIAGIGGFDLDELSQDGVQCRWEVYGRDQKMVVVRVPAPAKTIRLRLRWKGSPTPGLGRGFLLPDEALLLDIEGWLPFLPSTDATIDLEASWPEGFEVILEGTPGKPAPAGKGRLSVRTSFHSNAGTTVFARPKYAVRRFDLGGTPALVAAPPAMANALPGMEERVRAAYRALTPIGPLPPCELRVVQSTMTNARIEAFGGRSFIAFRSADPEVSLLAHEMAHSWFGGTIFAATVADDVLGRKAVRTELWPESLAEYASTWSMDERAFLGRRRLWFGSYAGEFGESIILGRSVASYTRAPLLLAGIEHRVGRPKMEAALAAFVVKNRGRRAEWKDVIDAISAQAGAAEAADLRAWIGTPGAPDLRLTDIVIENGVLTGTLAQTSDPPYPGTLELGFFAESVDETPKTPLSVHAFKLTGAETPVRLEIPKGAKTLLLDPAILVPRAIVDPSTPGVLAVPLDRELPRAKSGWFLTPP